MFLLAAEEGAAHHTPLIVEFVNHYLGEPIHNVQMRTTHEWWKSFFSYFGTTPEAMFGEYTVENAIPWYTIMFVIACILTVILIKLFKGKLSEEDPTPGQMTLEAGFLALKDLATSVIGEQGWKYFPVVATFAVLVLVSNLMGLFPLFMSPTASVNVTFALGITSFVYFNYVGIRENGLWKYIAHFTGPKLPWYMFLITALIFCIEIVSTAIRPLTLGVRLFANMFADEQLYAQISGIYPPISHFVVQVLILLPLGTFVALVQTLVFTLLSMIYISLALPHDEHHGEEPHAEKTGDEMAAATA